jgi:hypothetical protein
MILMGIAYRIFLNRMDTEVLCRHFFYSPDTNVETTGFNGGGTGQHLVKPCVLSSVHQEEMKNILTIWRIHPDIPSKRQVPEKDFEACCMFKVITIGICKPNGKSCKAPPPIYRQRRIVCMIEEPSMNIRSKASARSI